MTDYQEGFLCKRSSGSHGGFWPRSPHILVEGGYLTGASQIGAQILRRDSRKKCADSATSGAVRRVEDA